MDLKTLILRHLDREAMRRVLVDDLGHTGVGRRTPEAMRDMLTESPAATPKLMLEYLDVNEFRQICDALGISSKGGRWQVIDRIIASRTPEASDSPLVARPLPRTPTVRVRRNAGSGNRYPGNEPPYVQSCIAHIGFPKTLPEMRRAWEVGDGFSNMEWLLDTSASQGGRWTAPRWLTEGDMLFFYHTKRAKTRIRSLLAAARGSPDPEWAEVNDRAACVEFIEDQLSLAEQYAGTIIGVSRVVGAAAFEKGDADRHWRGNIYAAIDNPHIFERPLPQAEFCHLVTIRPGGALTPLHGTAFEGLKEILARSNRLPDFLVNARPGGLSFRDVDETNWIEISCSASARFIDEEQLRRYLIDYLLDEIADDGTAVHEECGCDSGGRHPCFADYFVQVGGVWLPVEAKLNVRAEANLPGQVGRYVDATQFIPTRGSGKGKAVRGRCTSCCLVVDCEGLYLVNSNGYVGCSPDEPLWRRLEISRRNLTTIRDHLRTLVAVRPK